MDVAVSTIVIIVMHGHFCLFVDFGTHQRRASQILIRLRGRFGRYSGYRLKQGGYCHLPLEKKMEIIKKIRIPEITVCEDVTEHYEYWRDNFNPNKDDCCNLRLHNG